MDQFDDLDPTPRYYLRQSNAFADELGKQAQEIAATPRPETGNAELNAQLDQFLSQLGGFMQDSAHQTKASNDHVADLARAEQSEQGSTEGES